VLFLWSCVRWLEIIIEDRSGMLFQWRLLTASARIRLQGLTKRAALLRLWKLPAFSRLEKMSSRSSCPRPHWRRSFWHLCYHPQCKAALTAPCAPRIDASHGGEMKDRAGYAATTNKKNLRNLCFNHSDPSRL
jgi:hypothetical protein